MDLAARWQELMRYPEESLPLDEAALVIAAHGNSGLDVTAQLRRLDGIATEIGDPSMERVGDVLFGQLGLRGDQQTYDDPRNSYLDQVLDRRRGIPISLSVVLIEIGRRCGLLLEGVGLPGHFLVRQVGSPESLIDAFHGGRRLDRSACQRLLNRVAGPHVQLTPAMLATTGRRAILARILANLDRSFERRGDYPSLLWVTRLRLEIPDLPLGDRMQMGVRLGDLGSFAEAAQVFTELAEAELAPEITSRLASEAAVLRARLN